MDPLTHCLASIALKRSIFPKVPRPVLISMLLAGTLADLDWLSSLFGPSVYFVWNGGPLHSVIAAIILAFAVSLAMRAYAKSRGILLAGALWWFAPVCTALLHVGIDSTLPTGVKLFWPLSSSRIELDWAPNFDLWVLVFLAAGILLPELFRLVTEEIGAKSKKPRGQVGATIALLLAITYFGARCVLHRTAVSLLIERSYVGESARRSGAFPDSMSPFLWHGVVETESSVHLLPVPTGPLSNFDPENALHIHKPEPSPILDAAQKTDVARQFLGTARFPKAAVQRETEGFSVEIKDLKYDALGQTSRVVEANINLNPVGQPTFAHLEWLGAPHRN